MSFLKKVGRLAKKAVKVYAAYQTGGLSQVAISALSRKKAIRTMAPMMASTLSSKYGGGFTATPASFLSTAGTVGRRALKAVPYVGTAATIYDIGKGAIGAFGGGAKPKKKYRRINPANIKALRRSIRRIKGAEKIFRQVLVVQGKPSGGIKPKTRKR